MSVGAAKTCNKEKNAGFIATPQSRDGLGRRPRPKSSPYNSGKNKSIGSQHMFHH